MKKHIISFINNNRTDRFILVLLFLNIIVFNLGAEKLFTNYIYIQIFDCFSMIIFTIEYFLRLSILRRPKDIFRPMLLMDLIALLPYYLAFLPCKLNFLRLITGWGDFYPAAGIGRILDACSLLICAGTHWIIADLVAPAFVKYLNKSKKPASV